jgi:hypothetical protein
MEFERYENNACTGKPQIFEEKTLEKTPKRFAYISLSKK